MIDNDNSNNNHSDSDETDTDSDGFYEVAPRPLKGEENKKRVVDPEQRKRIQELSVELEKSGTLLKEGFKDLKPDSKKTAQTIKDRALGNKKALYGTLGGLLIIIVGGVMWYQSMQPRQASKAYGVCKNFLELYIQFPDYLRLASVDERAPSKLEHYVRIWFSHRDGFGQKRMERMQCEFLKTPTGVQLRNVKVDTRDVDPKIVERFNNALPTIITVETDLSVPRNFPNKIRDLKIDYNRMRKRFF